MAESLCCPPESNKMLLISCTALQKTKNRKTVFVKNGAELFVAVEVSQSSFLHLDAESLYLYILQMDSIQSPWVHPNDISQSSLGTSCCSQLQLVSLRPLLQLQVYYTGSVAKKEPILQQQEVHYFKMVKAFGKLPW